MAQFFPLFRAWGSPLPAGCDNSWEPDRTGRQAMLYPDAQSPYPNDFSIDGWEMSGDLANGTMFHIWTADSRS